MLSIDLSKDWTNDTVTINSTPKPDGVPNVNYPSLWYHAKSNALLSGFAGFSAWWLPKPLNVSQTSLWKFVPNGAGGGTYSEAIAANDKIWSTIRRPAEPAQAYGSDAAFILGGNDQRQTVPIPGIVKLDMNTLQFTNTSAPWDKTPYSGSSGLQKGQMVHVPSFGVDGIYIAMGGYTTADANGLQSLKYVQVFDPSTQSWYNQSTAGPAPSGRIEFCATGIDSTSQSHEIFVYGGWGTTLGTAAVPYDTISILTLPAFQWITVAYPPSKPRFGHSCNAGGGAQIISIGGADAAPVTDLHNSFTSLENTLNTTTDPFTQGLAVFNMTSLSWADSTLR